MCFKDDLTIRGEVYRARDTKLDREVAIKVLPEEFAQDDERLARFEREAKLLASLNHPNIASIHGFEESGDVKALVLEHASEGADQLHQAVLRNVEEFTGGRDQTDDITLMIAERT